MTIVAPSIRKRVQVPRKRLSKAMRELDELEQADLARVPELLKSRQNEIVFTDKLALRRLQNLPKEVAKEVLEIEARIAARRKTFENGISGKVANPERWKKT